jgi:NAD(P)H-dependent flavin oxidoreductase YrpB (nitropropane dioxygenase family)
MHLFSRSDLKIRKAYVEGDVVDGSLTFGQVCGLIDNIPTCLELIHSISSGAETIMQSMQEKILSPVM